MSVVEVGTTTHLIEEVAKLNKIVRADVTIEVDKLFTKALDLLEPNNKNAGANRVLSYTLYDGTLDEEAFILIHTQ